MAAATCARELPVVAATASARELQVVAPAASEIEMQVAMRSNRVELQVEQQRKWAVGGAATVALQQ